ncbi:MAG: hypothetical protein U0270_30835 [Labilithrix sp.]
MKRSSVLSALVVGLSLTAAASASAAGPAAAAAGDKAAAARQGVSQDKAAVRQVAQVDSPAPNRQSADPSTPAPAPSSAPGAGASGGDASGAQPGVTVGTPTAANPTADTPQQAASEAQSKPKPRRFAGSSLFISNSMTTNTIFKGQTQYNDPTVESNFYITPRFAITDAFQLRARLIVSYEWTESDENTYNHEPTLSDTTLQLFYRKIPSFAGIQPAVAINAGLPTSKNSRARTLMVTPGVTGQLAKGFEHFLGGELSIITSLTYSHPIYKSRNPETLDPRPVPFQCLGGNGCSDLLSGTMNVSDSLSYSLIISPEWGKWNPAIAYIGGSSWAYHPTSTVNPIDGKALPVNEDATNYRQSHYLSAWLDYNFNPWITGEIGYWNAVAGIGGDGQRSNIIFDRYQDTRVYLGASIQLDNLVKTLQGTSEGAAGVVRAQNKPAMFTF